LLSAALVLLLQAHASETVCETLIAQRDAGMDFVSQIELAHTAQAPTREDPTDRAPSGPP
jgi:hypothetical protein